MDKWQFVILAVAVMGYGGAILSRLPKPKKHKDFEWRLPDYRISFALDNVLENEFEIEFIDEWSVGRPFALWGTVVGRDPDDEPKPLPFPLRERVGVRINPFHGWFERSRIGWTRVLNDGSEFSIGLPMEIAARLLSEVRHDKDQVVTLGIARDLLKDGSERFGIYSLQLSKR